MPHPTPMPVRHLIVQRAAQGQGARLIARCPGLVPRHCATAGAAPPQTRPNALATLCPSRPYSRPPQLRALIEEALQLRRADPTRGAGLVRVLLHRRYPADPIPAERTLQRWFRRAELIPAPSGRRAGHNSYQLAQQPHDVWQIDAADQVALQSGRQVCTIARC
jgi:hypothetical protein